MANSINKKRIAKNSILLYIRMAFNMLVALYTSRVLLKVLGVDDYGLYNVVCGVVVLFSFFNGTLAGSTSRFITFDLGKNDIVVLNRTFSAALLCHIGIALVVVVLSETIGVYLILNKMIIPEGRLSTALWIFQFSIATSVCSITQVPYNACIIAHERMNAFAYISIAETILKLAVVLILQMLDGYDSLFIYGVMVLCISILMTLCYRIYCKKFFKECSFRMVRDKMLYKRLLTYAGWDLIGNLSTVAQGQGLNVLLNIFFGPTVNAARAISVQVQGAISQFSGNFMLAVRPQIIKSFADGEIKQMLDLVYQASKYGYCLTYLIVAPLFVEMNYVLQLWLGKVPDYAVIFCRLILVVTLVNVLRSPFIAALHATGNIRLANILSGSILVSTLPLSYLFLKMSFSPVCVFWTTLVITFLIMWIDLLNLKRLLPISVIRHFFQIQIPCFFVSVVSSLIVIVLHKALQEGFLRLLLSVLISFVSTLLISYFVLFDSLTRRKIREKLRKKTTSI